MKSKKKKKKQQQRIGMIDTIAVVLVGALECACDVNVLVLLCSYRIARVCECDACTQARHSYICVL